MIEYLERLKNEPYLLGHVLGFNKLTQIHSEFIRYVYYPGKDRVLMAHRGSYKTTSVIFTGIFWCLLFWPDTRILIAQATASEAIATLKTLKRIYESDRSKQLYQWIYGKDPQSDSWADTGFSLFTKKKITRENNVEGVGVGGNVTGKHFDLIICDDIVTLKDRVSPAKREYTKTWVKEIQSVVDPKGHIAYIGTPHHENDVYSILPKPKKYPVGSIDIPELTEEILREKRNLQGESYFRLQYHLEVIPESDRLLPDPKYAETPTEGKVFAYLDPAFSTSETADYSALTIGKLIQDKAPKLHIFHGSIKRLPIDKLYDYVTRLCTNNKVTCLFIEANQSQRVIAHEFRRRGLYVKEIMNTKNKLLRITDALRKNWENITFSENIDSDYMRQIIDYNEFAQHDDAPDSLAGLVEAIMPTLAAQVKTGLEIV